MVELKSPTLNPAPGFGLEDSAVDTAGPLLAGGVVCAHGLPPGCPSRPMLFLTVAAPAKQSS